MALNALYLQDLPQEGSGKIIELTPATSSGNVSWQELELELAMMTQVVMTNMSNMLKFIAEQQQENSKIGELNVVAAQTQAKKVNDAVEQQQNEPLWRKILDVFVKYIVPGILSAIAAVFTCGGSLALTAVVALVATTIFVVTTVPVKDGQSCLSLATQGLADAIGKLFNLSPSQIEVLQGCIGVAIAIVVTAITAGAAGGAAGAFLGSTAFASIISGSNSFYNLFLGSYMTAHPDADEDKAKEIAGYFSLAMNLVTSLACLAGSGMAIYKGTQALTDLSTNVMNTLMRLQMVAGIVAGGGLLYQAGTEINNGFLMAAVTNALAKMKFIEGSSSMLNQNSDSLNTESKQIEGQYTSLLGHNQNFASPEFTEARALAMNNRA